MATITLENYLVGVDGKFVKLDRICDYFILRRYKKIGNSEYVDLMLVVKVGQVVGKLLETNIELHTIEEKNPRIKEDEIVVKDFFNVPKSESETITKMMNSLREIAKQIRSKQRGMIEI